MNSVKLIGCYGSDEIIACSAWTSTSRDLTEEKRGRIPSLIDKLWGDGHETPFEKGIVHFLVNSDIASHIHILKHRISSTNSESARYKELKDDKYYLPEDWLNLESSKDVYLPSSAMDLYDIPFAPKGRDWISTLDEYTKLGNLLYHQCLSDIQAKVGRKRAKESARFFKTYNSQIECDIMFNMRSFANFQKLRNSEHAQLEIREIAQKMLSLVREIEGNPFKHTLNAWEKYEVIPKNI